MTAERWDNSGDQAPAHYQQQHDTRNLRDCRCWTTGSFLYRVSIPTTLSTTQSTFLLAVVTPFLIISPQSMEGRREEKCESHICRRLRGGWFTDSQSDNTIRMSSTWLDINSRKHSSPVNTLIATGEVGAIFLTLCPHNINMRNILSRCSITTFWCEYTEHLFSSY